MNDTLDRRLVQLRQLIADALGVSDDELLAVCLHSIWCEFGNTQAFCSDESKDSADLKNRDGQAHDLAAQLQTGKADETEICHTIPQGKPQSTIVA